MVVRTGPANRIIGPPPLEWDGGDRNEDEQGGPQATRSRLADGCPGYSRFRSPDRTPRPFAFAALFVAVPQTGWAQTASQVTPPTYAPPSVRPAGPIVLPEGPGVTAAWKSVV